MSKPVRAAAAALLLGLLSQNGSAELIFSAPPREDPQQGVVIYEPLAKFMSGVLGQTVVYRHSENWGTYSEAIKAGSYDIVLDEPHLVSWRIEHSGHQPIVALQGSIHFYLYTAAAQSSLRDISDLKFHRFCAEALPNLSALAFVVQFDGPNKPRLVSAPGGLDAAYRRFLDGGCSAFVVRDSTLARVSDEEKANLKRLSESPHFPNLTLTVGPRVPAAKHQALQRALMDPNGAAAAAMFIDRYGEGQSTRFVRARARGYKGFNKLLEGVVWGWRESGLRGQGESRD